jgi:hypothetical protein
MLRVYTFKNTSYAVGFAWHPVSTKAFMRQVPRKLALQLARQQARNAPDEKYNSFVTGKQEYGLGTLSAPANFKTKIYSLAGSLRWPSPHKNFLGSFYLGDVWWILGVQNGIPATDVYFSTSEEAEREFNSRKQIAKPDTEFKSCATKLDTQSFLSDLLHPEKPIESLFVTVAAQKSLFFKAALGLLAAILLVAGWQIYSTMQEKKAEQLLRERFSASDQQRQRLLANPGEFFVRAWLDAPAVQSAGRQCIAAMLEQPLAVNGWTLEEMVCVPGKEVMVSYKHNRGADFVSLPPKLHLVTAKKASSGLALPVLAKSGLAPDTPLPSKEEAAAWLYQVTQMMRCRLDNFNWNDVEHKVQSGVMINAPWQSAGFTLLQIPVAHILDLEIFRVLNRPGIIISEISCLGAVWQIKGVIYGH